MTAATETPSLEQLRKIAAYWRAVSYLGVGQTYLFANPLLKTFPNARG